MACDGLRWPAMACDGVQWLPKFDELLAYVLMADVLEDDDGRLQFKVEVEGTGKYVGYDVYAAPRRAPP